MATRFGQRASGDSRTQNWQKRELNAMEVCRGYAEAQMEYAAAEHDGDHVLKYAQKITATSGKQDGLYLGGASDSPRFANLRRGRYRESRHNR